MSKVSVALPSNLWIEGKVGRWCGKLPPPPVATWISTLSQPRLLNPLDQLQEDRLLQLYKGKPSLPSFLLNISIVLAAKGKNCECCPLSKSLYDCQSLTNWPSMSWFYFYNLFGIVNCFTTPFSIPLSLSKVKAYTFRCMLSLERCCCDS